MAERWACNDKGTPMTPAQLSTLRPIVQAEPSLAQAILTGNDAMIAAWCNGAANPAFIVWKTAVSIDEIMRNGMDWARVDNLSVGKARIWDWLGRLGTFNASKPNVRAGIDATWVGTAADLAVRASVYVHCKRSATNAEKALATGTGSDAVPATLDFEGNVSVDEAGLLR
jgi:hypothetical protein